jgi:hypothetical protein
VWSVAGYIVGLIIFAIPIGALVLLTRTKRWQRRHRIRWAGSEMPLLWWRGADRDLPRELLDPPDMKHGTGRDRR